ncbi:hypothetical protein [Brevibacillus choshinensis]|uniref:Uncharacterized protein n=1 Tax=Brevibacillus choshinensis TaxID=54911 RepID=A0ABX7FQ00_BRECH|nr:hypothetical protein [Brevibacillus choshinensis]QRG68222.1 hypothetical protein JNE38_03325 [Brevibacillus choshinensis]
MKKYAWIQGLMLLFVAVLGGCNPITASPDQVQGLTKEEAAQIASAAVRQYYRIEVDATDRQITLDDPAKLVESTSGEPIFRGVPVHVVLNREPLAGEIAAYHAIIDPKSKQALSVSIDKVGPNGERAADATTEDDLERAAAEFIRAQKLLTPTAFQLVKSSYANPADLKRYFYYTDGLKAIAIGVDTQLQQVVTFTYI